MNGRNTDLSIVGICCCWNQETIGELDSLVSFDPDHQGAVAGCQDCEVLRWLEVRAVVTVDGGDGGVCLAAAVEGVLHPGGGVGEQVDISAMRLRHARTTNGQRVKKVRAKREQGRH